MLVQAMVLFRESLKEWTPVRRDGTANENGTQLRRYLRREAQPARSSVQGVRGGGCAVVGDQIHPTDTKRSRDVGDGRRGVDEPGRKRGRAVGVWVTGMYAFYYLLFPVDHFFCIAMCRACTVDLVNTVQRLRHPDPTSIL